MQTAVEGDGGIPVGTGQAEATSSLSSTPPLCSEGLPFEPDAFGLRFLPVLGLRPRLLMAKESVMSFMENIASWLTTEFSGR